MSFFKKVFNILVLFAGVLSTFGVKSNSINFDFYSNTPAQMSGGNCQSYSLALALTLADISGEFGAKDKMELEQLERHIRERIINKKKSSGDTNKIKIWKMVIEDITQNNYTLDYTNWFRSHEEFYEFLNNVVPVKLKSNPTSTILTLPRPTTLYMASFTEVAGNYFPAGNIVNIAGINKSSDISKLNQSLLIINSSDSHDICRIDGSSAKVKEFGYTNWIDAYTLSSWESLGINLSHIKKVEYVQRGVQSPPKSQELSFWINAFIPDNQPTKAAGRCFSTDNRGFSSAKEALYRASMRLRIVKEGEKIEVKSIGFGKIFNVGKTVEKDCRNGSLVASKTADVDRSMHYGTPTFNDNKIQLVFSASISNPLTPPVISPKIDWSGSIIWDTEQSTLSLDITVGKFPAFEVYAETDTGRVIDLLKVKPEVGSNPFTLYDFGLGYNTRRFTVKKSITELKQIH